MGIVFKNNAKTTLASSLSNSATTATVTDGSVFPSLSAGEFFLITFDDGSNNEICKCTARSGNTLTIVRAQESTTARAFSSGDSAEGRVTAGVLEQIQENIAAKSANQTVFNATTAGGATTYNIGTNPGVEANAMVFLNGVLQHHDTLSFSGTNLTFDAAPPNGMALEVIIDNLINLQSSNLTVDSFTAADSGGNPQTDFTLSDTPAAETNLIVFVDGVFQDQDAYTISSNTLTITTGVIAGRGVTVYVINPVNIGTPSDSTVTSAKLSGNITMPGTLTVGSNDVAFDSPTFVVDHTNSRVGLGTASPSVPVDIVGDVKMSANLTVDTTTLVVDSSNNRVGIGIQSPSKPLHIYSADNQPLRVESSDAYAGIEIKDSGSSTLPPLVSALGDDLLIYTGHASARLLVAKFQSSGKSAFKEIEAIDASLEIGNGDEKLNFDGAEQTIEFQTADAERMRITNSGVTYATGVEVRQHYATDNNSYKRYTAPLNPKIVETGLQLYVDPTKATDGTDFSPASYGNGNQDLTLSSGTSWGSNANRSYWTFDGTTNAGMYGNPNLSSGKACSFSYWLYVNDVTSLSGGYHLSGIQIGNHYMYIGIVQGTNDSAPLYGYIGQGTNMPAGGSAANHEQAYINSDEWVYLTIQCGHGTSSLTNRSYGRAEVYLNGSLVQRRDVINLPTVAANSSNSFWLGRVAGGYYLNGLIGPAVVYERTLHQWEILENMRVHADMYTI